MSQRNFSYFNRHQRAIKAVQKMGYEFHVTAAEVQDRSLEVTFRNTGIAPFYHSGWKVEVGFLAGAKVLRTQQTAWQLQGLLPGRAMTKTLPLVSPPPTGSVVAIRIPNPMPGGKPVRFANTSQDEHADGWLSVLQTQ